MEGLSGIHIMLKESPSSSISLNALKKKPEANALKDIYENMNPIIEEEENVIEETEPVDIEDE